MKTVNDLNALIPTLTELLSKNEHDFENCEYEKEEDGWGASESSTDNYFSYEKDGWLIEVEYKCFGMWESDPGDYLTPSSITLVKAWGMIDSIFASHYDEQTDEETEFTGDDLKVLEFALNKALERLS